jgi:hypothetical protein
MTRAANSGRGVGVAHPVFATNKFPVRLINRERGRPSAAARGTDAMTKIFNRILLRAGLILGAHSLLAAGGDYLDQHLKAKIGRSSPATERREQAAQAGAAFRQEIPATVAPSWVEQHMKGKVGRYSPAEEARIEGEKTSSASRQEPPGAAPNYIEQHLKGKLGRSN